MLLLLLPILGCQEATRPPSATSGTTVTSPPKKGVNTTPTKPSTKKPAPVVEDIYKVPVEFVRYVDKFYLLMGKAGLNNYRRPIQYMMDPAMKDAWAGTCTRSENSTVVRINPRFWWNNDFTARESLMFHELGHCILNRSHNDALDDYYDPLSIMHPNIIADYDLYTGNYRPYIRELFRTSPDKFTTLVYVPSYYWEHAYHSSVSTHIYREEFVTANAPVGHPPDRECGSH